MKEKLITLLKTFKYPVFLQGSLEPNEQYPGSFFTFWNNDTFSDGFYDNSEVCYVWDFEVMFYSNDPTLVNTKLTEAVNLLKQNGFIISGVGFDVASDHKTHTGRGVNALIIERKEQSNGIS